MSDLDYDLILKNIPDKIEYTTTTSLKMKRDILDFFAETGKDFNVLEMGVHVGMTTRVLSFLFNRVYACGINEPEKTIYTIGLDNITTVRINSYTEQWKDKITDVIDVFLIDAVHTYPAVVSDIKQALSLESIGKKLLIFDDYGAHPDVARAIDESIANGILEVVKYIGHAPNDAFVRNTILRQWEGIICKEI